MTGKWLWLGQIPVTGTVADPRCTTPVISLEFGTSIAANASRPLSPAANFLGRSPTWRIIGSEIVKSK